MPFKGPVVILLNATTLKVRGDIYMAKSLDANEPITKGQL